MSPAVVYTLSTLVRLRTLRAPVREELDNLHDLAGMLAEANVDALGTDRATGVNDHEPHLRDTDHAPIGCPGLGRKSYDRATASWGSRSTGAQIPVISLRRRDDSGVSLLIT